jgi:hypothetical protein
MSISSTSTATRAIADADLPVTSHSERTLREVINDQFADRAKYPVSFTYVDSDGVKSKRTNMEGVSIMLNKAGNMIFSALDRNATRSASNRAQASLSRFRVDRITDVVVDYSERKDTSGDAHAELSEQLARFSGPIMASFDYVDSEGKDRFVDNVLPGHLTRAKAPGKTLLNAFVQQEDGSYERELFRVDRITNFAIREH